MRTAACIGFMHWEGPILTDSGGFQVFSLATLRKITEEGVSFRSPVNGDPVLLTPERSMQVQRDLDADIVMIFDECTPYPATEEEARARWSCRCAGPGAVAPSSTLQNPHALFGIVQGGMYSALRAGVARWADADRFRRLRDRRPGGRRAEGGARARARCDRAARCRPTGRAI